MLKNELEAEVKRLQEIIMKAAKDVVDAKTELSKLEAETKVLRKTNEAQVRESENLKENREKAILLITMALETRHIRLDEQKNKVYSNSVDANTLKFLKRTLQNDSYEIDRLSF